MVSSLVIRVPIIDSKDRAVGGNVRLVGGPVDDTSESGVVDAPEGSKTEVSGVGVALVVRTDLDLHIIVTQ